MWAFRVSIYFNAVIILSKIFALIPLDLLVVLVAPVVIIVTVGVE